LCLTPASGFASIFFFHSSEGTGEDFDYDKQTLASERAGRAITQSELEMAARYINQPGAVQSFGAFLLVSLEGSSMKIIGCSSNCEQFLGKPSSSVIGAHACDLFEESSSVREAIQSPKDTTVRVVCGTPKGQDGQSMPKVNLIVMQSAQGVCIDVEPCASDACPGDDDERVKHSIANVDQDGFTRDQLLQAVVDEIQELAGYDRVMMYAFHEDMHGEVVSEALANKVVRSYVNLHFPATDIPQRSRDLYLLNKARIISDTRATPVPLICASSAAIKPDTVALSISTTRAVHPCHLEYMQNWGVSATLVLSVRLNGKLWGLVVCHHESSTRFVSYKARMACAAVVDAFASRLAVSLNEEKEASMRQFHSTVSTLLDSLKTEESFNLTQLVAADAELSLLNVIEDVHGAALVAKDGTVHTIGQVPSTEQIIGLARWRLSDAGAGVASVSCLKEVYPAEMNDNICGMLSIPLLNGSVLMWFRREDELEVKWSGNPNEGSTYVPGSTMHPRKSFETYVETIRGRSKSWSIKVVAMAAEFADSLDSEWADTSEQCVFALDISGKIIRFNETISEALGVTKRNAIGTHFSKLCPIGGNVLDGLMRITSNGPHDVYLSLRSDTGILQAGAELLGCAHPLADFTGKKILLFVGEVVDPGAERNPLAATMDNLCAEGMFESYQSARNLLPNTSKVPLEIPHQLCVLNKVCR
jgi:chemotaxis family two-component system sensor kinase Cph1